MRLASLWYGALPVDKSVHHALVDLQVHGHACSAQHVAIGHAFVKQRVAFGQAYPGWGNTGVVRRIQGRKAPIVAVSPIVGGQALKGPAAKMMQELGRDVSVLGVAQHYQGLIDGLVFDTQDAHLAPRISDFGIQPFVTDTIMTDLNSRIGLAKATLSFCDEVQK